MSVKYSWNRQNGAAMPSVRFMSIEPAEDYYKGMPLKLKEKGIVEPTNGDPEYICMAEYNPDAEIQPLEIPVQEVFPDVVYDRMNEDGSIEEVRFGSKGGGVSEERLTEAINEVKEMISGIGAQSDLSETDSTSKAYVKGKLQERHIPDSLARKDEIPTTPQEVGADPTGTAETAVSTHNTATDAHNDIRLLVEGLAARLNTIANSTDVDLDQLAEIVAYIKNNKSLIDGITTSKVNVTDIIDNLTTNVANKPLSAAQGVVLKGLIDGLSSGKLDASKLTEAINTALAQAKASGEFKGEPGYTPVKGTDYYTAADKTEMVNAVIAALPTWNGGSY